MSSVEDQCIHLELLFSKHTKYLLNLLQQIIQSRRFKNHSNNNDYDSQTPSNDKDNSEDGTHGELDSSQQLKDLNSNKIVHHEDQDILTKESNNSTMCICD